MPRNKFNTELANSLPPPQSTYDTTLLLTCVPGALAFAFVPHSPNPPPPPPRGPDGGGWWCGQRGGGSPVLPQKRKSVRWTGAGATARRAEALGAMPSVGGRPGFNKRVAGIASVGPSREIKPGAGATHWGGGCHDLFHRSVDKQCSKKICSSGEN